jgi:hypothetical protein
MLVDSRCHICIASSCEGHCHCQSANEATGSLRPASEAHTHTHTHCHTHTVHLQHTQAGTRARAVTVTHTHRPGPTRPRRPAMAGPLAAPCQAAKLPTRKAEVSCGAQLRKRRGGPASTGGEHRLGSRPRRPGPGAAKIRARSVSASATGSHGHGGAAGGACVVAYTCHLAARALLSGHPQCSKVHCQ